MRQGTKICPTRKSARRIFLRGTHRREIRFSVKSLTIADQLFQRDRLESVEIRSSIQYPRQIPQDLKKRRRPSVKMSVDHPTRPCYKGRDNDTASHARPHPPAP